MKRYRGWTILLIAAVTACATQTQSVGTGLRYPNDAAAIRALFDTSAAGWNRGELPVYLSVYTESATAMGAKGPERGVNAIGDQMRAGYWKTGRPVQVRFTSSIWRSARWVRITLSQRASTCSPARADRIELAGSQRFGLARQRVGG